MEGAAEVVGVEAGDDDALAEVGEAHDEVNHRFAEKLRFVDADDFGATVEVSFDLGCVFDADGADAQLGVRDDVVLGIALVDAGFEDLDALPRNLGTTQPADEFFTLAAEHGAADYFDPSQIAFGEIHFSAS